MALPITDLGPTSVTSGSVMLTVATPVSSAMMLPRSPTWRSRCLGEPWLRWKGRREGEAEAMEGGKGGREGRKGRRDIKGKE